ncbi:tRNA (adenosine(37)-N6)-dimethylallyltransferase MiaA [Aureimonas populi]|uniref:tRNA dimethylallyltransferase n=1 Tax=Aureimonas populi TaxID=1701758 RepID=A0ABW5CNJ1_9HYPH|nr:tRNA (adenosine(37)-N6)-dimethylallyltransferase MiaA [Aureimonas populi]
MKAILIAGPTASGKSALAIRLARKHGGAVVNADSMQVYDGLPILTARPREEEMEGLAHLLYGHRDPAQPYSTGEWAREAAGVLADLRRRGLVPVFCGGTGLYFRALLGGLDDMPPVPEEVRARWRGRMEAEGPQALHRLLAERDGAAAARIRPGDRQRIARALELLEATGAPLAQWRKQSAPPLIEEEAALKLVIAPQRPALRERIARRFDAMLATGAMEEALAFARRPGALEGLAGNAIGLAELLEVQAGRLEMGRARELAITRTRQYAKRQETWFRNQLSAHWRRIEEPEAFGGT